MEKFLFEDLLIFENHRVRLTPLEHFHYQDLIPIALSDPNLLRYSPSSINSQPNLKNYIECAMTSRQHGSRYSLIIFDKEKGMYAGSTSFGNISNSDRRLEIGWTWIGKYLQGTGLNKACKALMLQYVFDTLGFERVEFKIDSRNLQSRKAVEKLGAVFEGELRSHTVMLDGFRRNTVLYSILKGEWTNLRVNNFNTELFQPHNTIP